MEKGDIGGRMDVGGREMFAYSIWTVCKMPESYPSGEAE